MGTIRACISSPGVILWRNTTILFILCLFVGGVSAQQNATGVIRGKVADANGALIRGASVTLADASGVERKTQTNQDGVYVFNILAVGKYVVRATSGGFAPFERRDLEVLAGKTLAVDIMLSVTITENVNVTDERAVSTEPESNASAIVLKGNDIKALPDDPAELQAALEALAGPGAGPNGGEIFIDGFSGGKLPPRDTIKEIRINQNPFSSEYDRMGLGRIEIITKPGTEKWQGEFATQFEDESFNSRNPYAANRPPFQLRTFEGDVSGPLIKKRASFFIDAERQSIDNNALINAQILDQNLNVVRFQRAVLTPSLGIEINPRVDLQINEKNSLTVRYGYSRDTQRNAGLGGFDLLSRVYNTIGSEHSLRFSETAILSPTVVNESRFQYVSIGFDQNGGSNLPTVRVNDAFTSGGASIPRAARDEKRVEFQNNTSFLLGGHILKVGGRLRHAAVTDVSPANFAGTFTFTSIDQYRNTILNLPGAFPAQFLVAGGNPRTSVTMTDWGLFAQDDWRLDPKLTLSFGLRYENQSGISDNSNFAPRFGFAYAPGLGPKKTPKTVFRGGFGVFYERFARNFMLQANRYNGSNQQQFLVTDPAILDNIVFTVNGVSNVPTIQSLTAFSQLQTTRVIAPDQHAQASFQSAFSVERQLPFKTTVSVTYVNTIIHHLLRSRNINAPANGVRPIAGAGNIFQYESTGRYRQNQLIFNLRSNFSEQASVFGNYSFGGARSDSDGAGTFPANTYDLSNEYGNSLQDIRHRFTLGGSYTAPLGFRFSPFITFRTGVPFNITTGNDTNGDTLFTERPSFATSLAEPGIVITRFGAFDPTPEAGDTIIPRNYGRSTKFFGVNLNVAKEFGFGGAKKGTGGAKSDEDDEAPYKLEFSVQVRNLFNRTNKGTPVGNLRSPFFGEPVSVSGGFGGGGGGSTAGNRRIRFEVQFSF